MTSLSWFVPIRKKMNSQIGPIPWIKCMLGSFLKRATVGIWETPIICLTKLIAGSLKSGIGAELRIATSAYYLFP